MTNSDITDIVWDAVILGAGIAGCAVAQNLSKLGYKVLLIDKNTELAKETSNNTLGVIHGGFRYLQSLDLLRVIKSAKDQNKVLNDFSTEVKLFKCIMPLSASGLKSKLPVSLACLFYKILYYLVNNKKVNVETTSTDKVLELCSLYQKQTVQHGALLWEDGRLFSHQELITKLFLNCCPELLLETEVKFIRLRRTLYELGVCSKEKETLLKAKCVVNALGPWINNIKKPYPDFFPNIKWGRSYNLVVNKIMPEEVGLSVESKEKRLFFLVPRNNSKHGEHSALGTFNSLWTEPIENLRVEKKEICEALDQFNFLVPQFKICESDVLKIESGLLPLKAIKKGQPIFLSSEKIKSFNGYTEILSTKYTTFYSQAEKASKQVIKHLTSI